MIGPTRLLVDPFFHSCCWQAGQKAVSYDVRRDSAGQDLTSPVGFLHALAQVLRLGGGTRALLAPVCSGWVYLPLSSISAGQALGQCED